jgi:adenosylmethionine-8-amino-7-oxononanoate aminotransferase
MEIVEQCNEESLRFVNKTYDYWVETDSNKYLDLMCGHGAYIWGYSNQRLTTAVESQLRGVQFLRGRSSEQNHLVNKVNTKLLQMSGMCAVLYAISGSDGVEAGLEIVDQYWKNVDNKKNKIISFVPGYHGATYRARQLRGEKPSTYNITLPAPSNQVPDEIHLLDLVKKITNNDDSIGTIIMESIPWINGLRPWTQHWWEEIRNICDQKNILMVVDDVWGGFGKVGPAFSYQNYNVKPDIAVMGKSITGGYVPLSCALISDKVNSSVKNTVFYGHTWQPQMLGIALVNQVLDMFDYQLVKDINLQHEILIDKLKVYGLVDYRGTGLAKELIFKRSISKQNFEYAGLCTPYFLPNSVILVTPITADANYWQELEQRLIKLLQNK